MPGFFQTKLLKAERLSSAFFLTQLLTGLDAVKSETDQIGSGANRSDEPPMA
jgi:hypothetical protein